MRFPVGDIEKHLNEAFDECFADYENAEDRPDYEAQIFDSEVDAMEYVSYYFMGYPPNDPKRENKFFFDFEDDNLSRYFGVIVWD